jgi:Na+-transporting NADH:ubiquinone oxidoreductase subunit C
MQSKNSIQGTLLIAGIICFVCSILVSGAAVSLRPIQEKNVILDKKRNILTAAGLYTPGADVEELFKDFETRIVNLETGEFADDVDTDTFDQQLAARNAETSVKIPKEFDCAALGRRSKYAQIYLYKNDGKLDQIILPVRGPGLWSMLYGYMAIDQDTTTVRGLGYYKHAETPGLGGEVDNPRWKNQWSGKQLFDGNWQLKVSVLKGKVDLNRKESIHQTDGLSGAPITTRGVDNMMKYWFGEHGFGPFLDKLRSGA